MADVTLPYTFTNGAGNTIDATQVNANFGALADILDAGFNTYKVIRERTGASTAAPAAATFILPTGSGADFIASPGSNSPAQRAFYLDPTDFAVAGRDSKLRVRAGLITNAVAPTTNWTVGLYPVATWGGASGTVPHIASLGAVTSGSTVLFTAPSAGAAVQGNSGDFAIPTAGWYALAVVNSGAAAANSFVSVVAALQLRQV